MFSPRSLGFTCLAMVAGAASFASCAAPCLPFARPAHEVTCNGDVLVATFYARNDTVLSPSCAAHLDGGIVVATVSGVVCPGEQFERLANTLTVNCTLPSLEPGAVPVHEGQVSLVTDGGSTVCRSP